jgi:hypothetical protein
MAKERKPPQEKKQLEYTRDHFTFAEHAHAFRKQWPQKKVLANRKSRRRADEFLAQTKLGISGEEAEQTTADLSVTQVKKLALRQSLRKSGIVTVGEKVRLKLEQRRERTGRRANAHRKYEAIVKEALETLHSLEGDALIDTVRRANQLILKPDRHALLRLMESENPLDRAIHFYCDVCFDNGYLTGNGYLIDSIRRNPTLYRQFWLWVEKAERILRKDRRSAQRKLNQKITIEKRVKTLTRKTRSS